MPHYPGGTSNFHAKLRSKRGSATFYPCVDCGSEAREWSWIHDTNHLDICNYEPRCRKCHLAYDNRNPVPHLRKLTNDQVREIRSSARTDWRTDGTSRRFAAKFNVTKATIRNVLNFSTYKEVKLLRFKGDK